MKSRPSRSASHPSPLGSWHGTVLTVAAAFPPVHLSACSSCSRPSHQPSKDAPCTEPSLIPQALGPSLPSSYCFLPVAHLSLPCILISGALGSLFLQTHKLQETRLWFSHRVVLAMPSPLWTLKYLTGGVVIRHPQCAWHPSLPVEDAKEV